MAKTTVLLVDDHLLIRQGCRRILEQRPDVTVVGEASTGEEALEKVETLRPAVVFLDVNLPGISGIEVTRRLRLQHPLLKVIVLSVHTDEAYVSRALTTGASAYIVKQGAARELEEALEAVIEGHVYLSPLISRAVVNMYIKHATQTTRPDEALLTPKEREVLQLLTRGLSSKEMGQQLKVSSQTVDVHRKSIMKKLNLHTVPELVKWAIRQKLISLEE
jgi:two-component system, NarL family, response regulator NreC